MHIVTIGSTESVAHERAKTQAKMATRRAAARIVISLCSAPLVLPEAGATNRDIKWSDGMVVMAPNGLA